MPLRIVWRMPPRASVRLTPVRARCPTLLPPAAARRRRPLCSSWRAAGLAASVRGYGGAFVLWKGGEKPQLGSRSPTLARLRIHLFEPTLTSSQPAHSFEDQRRRLRRVQKAGLVGQAALLSAAAASLAAGAALLERATRPQEEGAPRFPALPAPLADALAGGWACALQDAVACPADTLKIRMQAGVPPLAGGLRSIYAGAGPSLVMHVLHGALYMPLYSAIKSAARDGLSLPAPLAATAAAMVAVLSVALVEIPGEALLMRVKTEGLSFRAAAAAACRSRASLLGLYSGIAPFLARHVLFEAAEFAMYELQKSRQLARAEGGPLLPAQAAGMAAWASAAATVVSHPLDVIRTECSLGGGGRMGPSAAARRLLARGGVDAFGAGLLPRLVANVPGSVAFFTAFEAARGQMGPQQTHAH